MQSFTKLILEIFFVPTKPYSGSKKFPVIIYLWCDPLFKRDYKKFYIFYYYKRKVMCIRSIKLPNRSSSCSQSTILVSDRSLFILHVICIFFWLEFGQFMIKFHSCLLFSGAVKAGCGF